MKNTQKKVQITPDQMQSLVAGNSSSAFHQISQAWREAEPCCSSGSTNAEIQHTLINQS